MADLSLRLTLSTAQRQEAWTMPDLSLRPTPSIFVGGQPTASQQYRFELFILQMPRHVPVRLRICGERGTWREPDRSLNASQLGLRLLLLVQDEYRTSDLKEQKDECNSCFSNACNLAKHEGYGKDVAERIRYDTVF